MYDFRTVRFGSGSHETREDGMCIMEAAAYIAGEEHSDEPACVCKSLGAFCREFNDGLNDDSKRAELLGPFLWRLPGTNAGEDVAIQRGNMALDWLVRTQAPRVLEYLGELPERSKALRNLEAPVIGDASEALKLLKPVRRECRGSLAYPAIRAAERACEIANGESQRVAALVEPAFAGDCIVRILPKPLESELQESACQLLDRMIQLTEIQEWPAEWHQRARQLLSL